MSYVLCSISKSWNRKPAEITNICDYDEISDTFKKWSQNKMSTLKDDRIYTISSIYLISLTTKLLKITENWYTKYGTSGNVNVLSKKYIIILEIKILNYYRINFWIYSRWRCALGKLNSSVAA